MHDFHEYFLLLERIGWRLTEFDFAAIDMENITDDDRQRARDTAITESGVPHYSAVWDGVEGISDQWELRQFATLWTAEEHRHSEGLRMLCEALGVDASSEFEAVRTCDFVAKHNGACPSGCYNTVSGLLTYTTLQELVTWKFYQCWTKATKSTFIKGLVGKIAADEIRHHQWFANALQRYLPLAQDQTAYRQGIVDAIQAFHMPHNYYPVRFPFFDETQISYFTEEDFQQLRDKITKVVSFDADLVMMLLEIGEEKLMANVGKMKTAA